MLTTEDLSLLDPDIKGAPMTGRGFAVLAPEPLLTIPVTTERKLEVAWLLTDGATESEGDAGGV